MERGCVGWIKTWEVLQIIQETLRELADRKLGDKYDTESINEHLRDLVYLLNTVDVEKEMNNQTVWLLYEQSGEYSDYRLGIRGIFSSVENAKIWLEKDCGQRVERDKTFLPENLLTDWTKRTSWEPYEAGEIEWHCSLVPQRYSYDNHEWAIVPYVIDVPKEA